MDETPVLVGMIKLPFPKILSRDGDVVLYGSELGIDSSGRAWLLVQQATRIADIKGRRTLRRMTFSHWQRVAPIRFVEASPIEIFDRDPLER